MFSRAILNLVRIGFLRAVSDKGMLISDLGIATLVPYGIQFALWGGIFQYQEGLEILGYSRSDLLFYYAFAISIGRLSNGYDVVESLANDLYEGRLDRCFLKPLYFPLQRFTVFVGESLIYWIPLIFVLILKMYAFGNVNALLLAIVVVPCSLVLCFLVSFLIGQIVFWLDKGDFVLSALSMSAALFGGTLLPATFWPEWISPVMLYNPYRFIVAYPAEILSRADWKILLSFVVGVGLYTLTLLLVNMFVWKRATKKYRTIGG